MVKSGPRDCNHATRLYEPSKVIQIVIDAQNCNAAKAKAKKTILNDLPLREFDEKFAKIQRKLRAIKIPMISLTGTSQKTRCFPLHPDWG